MLPLGPSGSSHRCSASVPRDIAASWGSAKGLLTQFTAAEDENVAQIPALPNSKKLLGGISSRSTLLMDGLWMTPTVWPNRWPMPRVNAKLG
mmetsp:Transcript_84645/g.103754  ORF Transcript_84645/g.103754 Transcript_84645/m.103754 type:complete len:92 (-) Transcript_84645:152-427(-)